jgi:glycine cleavage system aminomethyltransferase T
LENNVYEIGLDYLVDESKRADYVGREALQRIKAEGVKRKLAGIEIEGARIEMNAVQWRVKSGGDEVGKVTSAIYSPRLKKNLGYAMVPVKHAAMGTELRVKIPGVGERRATVVPRPFIDPKKEIPKS